MSKRFQIINVLRKPRKCPNCGEEVWDIIYGTENMEPWEFLTEYRKSASMGGNIIPIRPPVWECSCCNTRFRKIKPDGTDAPVKIQLLANIKPAPATRIIWSSSTVEPTLENHCQDLLNYYLMDVETELEERETYRATALSEADAEQTIREVVEHGHSGLKGSICVSVKAKMINDGYFTKEI